MNNQVFLTLLGKVDLKILKKASKSNFARNDDNWFFVDYSSVEIAIGETFDVVLEGYNKTLVPITTSITLKKTFDQLGNLLNSIPKGFQTICNFQFSNAIPKEIDNLPFYREWKYNENSVSIAKHQGIQLSEPDFIFKSMNEIFLVSIKNSISPDSFNFSKELLTEYLEDKYGVSEPNKIRLLINRWKILGLIEEKQNHELELITEPI